MNIIAESILIGVCIGVAVIAALIIIATEINELFTINSVPKTETYATVVAKRVRKRVFKRKEKRYYVEYVTDEDVRFECRVEKEVYNKLNTGDMGIVAYQGVKYLGFRKAC